MFSYVSTAAAISKFQVEVSPICFSVCQTSECICQNKQMEGRSVRAWTRNAKKNENRRELVIWLRSRVIGCYRPPKWVISLLGIGSAALLKGGSINIIVTAVHIRCLTCGEIGFLRCVLATTNRSPLDLSVQHFLILTFYQNDNLGGLNQDQ